MGVFSLTRTHTVLRPACDTALGSVLVPLMAVLSFPYWRPSMRKGEGVPFAAGGGPGLKPWEWPYGASSPHRPTPKYSHLPAGWSGSGPSRRSTTKGSSWRPMRRPQILRVQVRGGFAGSGVSWQKDAGWVESCAERWPPSVQSCARRRESGPPSCWGLHVQGGGFTPGSSWILSTLAHLSSCTTCVSGCPCGLAGLCRVGCGSSPLKTGRRRGL